MLSKKLEFSDKYAVVQFDVKGFEGIHPNKKYYFKVFDVPLVPDNYVLVHTVNGLAVARYVDLISPDKIDFEPTETIVSIINKNSLDTYVNKDKIRSNVIAIRHFYNVFKDNVNSLDLVSGTCRKCPLSKFCDILEESGENCFCALELKEV